MRVDKDEARHGSSAGQVPKAIHFLAQMNSTSMIPQEFLLGGHSLVLVGADAGVRDESG